VRTTAVKAANRTLNGAGLEAKRKGLPPRNLNQTNMPVKYKIDKANRIIRTRCIGPVTIEEVVDHFRVLERDPDCPDRVDVLLDLSEETSIPEKANLQRVAEEIRRIRGRVQFDTCAVVAGTDALFGMLRMLEVFAEQYFCASFVFRTVNEAEVWLASKHPTTSAAGRAQT
jgi:hypothetical protein